MAGTAPFFHKRSALKFLLLPLLVLVGVLVQKFGLVDWQALVELGRAHAHHWWFAPVVVLLMTISYTLALPGSIFIWISAVLFTPVVAAVVITLGGVAGGAAAHRFSRTLSQGATARISNSIFFAMLQRHSDFIALSVLRLVPGIPHVAINYGAGILRLPLSTFIPATLIGFAAKGYLYAAAIYQVTMVDEAGDFLSPQLLTPLLLIIAIFLAAKLYMLRRLRKSV